jgi:hypothetical protein
VKIRAITITMYLPPPALDIGHDSAMEIDDSDSEVYGLELSREMYRRDIARKMEGKWDDIEFVSGRPERIDK